jgi:hypothetical protein
MDVLKSLIRVALVVAGVVVVLPARGDVVHAPTTAAALDALAAGLTGVMAHGESTGDYVLAKAAVKAKHAIDLWRTANRERLDTPFADLDPVVRETFERARTLIADATDVTKDPAEVAHQLTEHASQIVDTRPGPARQAYILGFTPRIVSPLAATTFTVRVRGLNLDKADPVLHVPGGRAERVLNGPHEAQFTVPVEVIPSHPTRLRVHTLEVTYTTPRKGFLAWLFKERESVSRQLSLVRLPTSVATFELSGTRVLDKRSEMAFTAEPVQFRGTREHVVKVIGPPPGSRDGTVAWKWDLNKDLRLVQSRGVQGRCEGIDLNRSSESGITVVARVEGQARGRQKRRPAPGWVDCTLVGTVYRIERASVPIDRQTVTLTWTREESVELPPDTVEAELMVTTFDGRVRRVSDSDDDKFFEVRREGHRFVIAPRVPEDVLVGD